MIDVDTTCCIRYGYLTVQYTDIRFPHMHMYSRWLCGTQDPGPHVRDHDLGLACVNVELGTGSFLNNIIAATPVYPASGSISLDASVFQ
jgi:hypothetical protein